MVVLVSGQLVVYSYDAATHKPNGFWHDTGEWNTGVEWTLDARGHVVREDISVNGAYRHRDYTYDPRGFLVATAEGSRTAHYSYTAAGLLATAKDELGLRTVHPGAAQSFLVGTNIYEYDDLGRVVRKGDIELRYGPDGQLAAARRGDDEWTYHHDQHGNRLLKLHNGHPVAAYIDGSYITADRIITPVRVAGRLIGVLDGNEFHLLAVDPRGTVLSDRDGTPRSASPYGVRSTRPDLAEALDYVEKAYDPVLGTVRMGVRDYDPMLGQFLTPDPLFFADPAQCITSPVECNLYGYAKNNPLNYIDPGGLGALSWLADVAIGAGEAAWDTGAGLYTIVRHPIRTAEGAAYAVTHPVQTATAVWEHGKQTVSSCLAGSGNACGSIVFEAASVAIGGGAALKLRKVSKTADAARTARVVDRAGGILRSAGDGSWVSRGGLHYGVDPNFGNRVRHVLNHASDIPLRRGAHGVFDAGRTGALSVVDEAWAIAVRGGSSVSVVMQGARTIYTVDMGRRIGFIGGQAGAAAGYPAAFHVRLVIEGTDVITAFPVRP